MLSSLHICKSGNGDDSNHVVVLCTVLYVQRDKFVCFYFFGKIYFILHC